MRWDDCQALVTGADGFIGSHLAERLVAEGARVRALVQYNSFGTRGWLDNLDSSPGENLEIVFGDIRDARQVRDIVAGCSVVFHLAALISVPYSLSAPFSFYETNVGGTLNILDAARVHGGAKVIQTSTSEVYGTPTTVPIREDHPLRAQSPYAASKIAADKFAESFHLGFDLPVVTLRPFNTYGPRQSARAVITAILSQLAHGAPTIELGALWPRRDFTYVDDTVAAFLKAAEIDDAVGKTIHLGTGRDVSIGELAEIAMSVTGVRAEIRGAPERLRPERSEVERLVSDPSIARATLGWQPSIGLETGLDRTFAWIRGNLTHYSPQDYLV